MNEKIAIAWFLFLNPSLICQLFKIFFEKSSRDKLGNLLTRYLYFKMLRTMSSSCQIFIEILQLVRNAALKNL